MKLYFDSLDILDKLSPQYLLWERGSCAQEAVNIKLCDHKAVTTITEKLPKLEYSLWTG